MKVLHLVLKHKWYDMIASGEKTEEYRELKPCYINRFCKGSYIPDGPNQFQDYTHICFHRAYTSTVIYVELKGISVGIGNPAWGAPDYPVFILHLGKQDPLIWRHIK